MIGGVGGGCYSRCGCEVSQQCEDIVREGFWETTTAKTTCEKIPNMMVDPRVDGDNNLRAITPGLRWRCRMRVEIFRPEFGS